MTREQAIARARQNFDTDFNCAESVLLTMAKYWGIRSNAIPRIATPFGGGLARSGLTCGAVTGAIMAIGLKVGRDRPEEDNERCYELTQKFMKRFSKRFGDTACYGLIDLDISTASGRREWEKRSLHDTCSGFVEWAVGELCKTFPMT